VLAVRGRARLVGATGPKTYQQHRGARAPALVAPGQASPGAAGKSRNIAKRARQRSKRSMYRARRSCPSEGERLTRQRAARGLCNRRCRVPAEPLTSAQVSDLLAAAPPRIAALTADLLPAQLRAAPAPDAWSVNDVLAHLRARAPTSGATASRRCSPRTARPCGRSIPRPGSTGRTTPHWHSGPRSTPIPRSAPPSWRSSPPCRPPPGRARRP